MSSPEQFLISSILQQKDFPVAIGQNISTEMFKAFPDEWLWLESYYGKYKKTPSKKAFSLKFPRFKIKDVQDTAHFAEEVKMVYAKKLLTATVHETAQFLASGDVTGAVQYISSEAVKIASGIGTGNDSDIASSYDDIFNDVKSRVERFEEKGYSGVPTGFRKLDRITGGLQPGTLTIIGARLGEGKSMTMQRMAVEAMKCGMTIQFDALEQSRAEVGMRIHSMLSSDIEYADQMFSSSDLMRGEGFDIGEYKRFLRKLKRNVSGQMHVSDASRGKVGLMHVASQIERNQPHIVFIDYITLMQKGGSDWQDVGELSAGLKQIAVQYGVPIVAAAQLNRANGLGSEPAGPEALAQSDAIGQDADMVVTMRKQGSNIIAYKLAKSRNTRDGFLWYCHYRPDKGIFEEVSFDRMRVLKSEASDETYDDDDSIYYEDEED